MFSSRAFLNRFHEFSRRRRLIEERNKIVAAVSGGADSTVLLDLLAKEQEAFGLTIIVAHFNHQLRGSESEGDELFVAQRARHYGFELYVERANTAEYARHNKLGIQEGARKLRYDFFEKLLVSSGFDKIATAHNADDNAETILLNLFRGAGVQGLSGIPILREDRKIIRPLLFAQRSEIEEYATAEQLTFRTDSSNEKDTYTRELEAFLTYTARQNFELMIAKRTDEEMHLSIPRLRSNPVLLQQYIVMLAGDQFAHRKLEYEQVNAILELTEGLTGSWVALSKEYVVFRDREHLVMRKTEPVSDFKIVVQPNHRYEFNKFRFSSEVMEESNVTLNGHGGAEYVDADRIESGELVLRTWSEGDAFVPLGMKTKKKISDFFVDAKIPIYEKHHIPILETRDGQVVWVCGQRIDDRFKITSDTKRVMKLEFSRATDKANDKKR
ncbi:MAG: tRNA(Ile)-lysidine synthase [Bacteroidetes bacterium]|nr:tRNA(Ile)-lysidine synthase [Bacteroidota bacterium]